MGGGGESQSPEGSPDVNKGRLVGVSSPSGGRGLESSSPFKTDDDFNPLVSLLFGSVLLLRFVKGDADFLFESVLEDLWLFRDRCLGDAESAEVTLLPGGRLM